MKKLYLIQLISICLITQNAKSSYYDYWPVYYSNAHHIQVAKSLTKKDYDGTSGNICYVLDANATDYGFMIFNGSSGEPKYEGSYLKSRGLPVGYDIDFNGEFDKEQAIYLLNPSAGFPFPTINGIVNHEVITSYSYDIIPPASYLSGSVAGLAMGLRKTSSIGNCYGVAIYSYQKPSTVLRFGAKIFAYDNTFFIPGFEVDDIPLPTQFNANTTILDVICMPHSFCIISKNATNTSRYRIDTYDYSGNYFGFINRNISGNTMNYSKFTFLQKGDDFFTIGEINNGTKDRIFIDRILVDPLTHAISCGTTTPGILNLSAGNSVTYTGKFDLVNTSYALIEGYVPTTNKRIFYAIDENSFTGTSFVQENESMNNLEPFMYLPAGGGDFLRTYSINVNDELIIKNFDVSYLPFNITANPTCHVRNEIQGDFPGGSTLDYYLTGAVQIEGAFENGGIIFSSASTQSVILMADFDFATCLGNKNVSENDIVESTHSQSVLIYPNPSSEKITITIQNNITIDLIEIYNIRGELIESYHNIKDKIVLESDLPAGTYFLRYTTADNKSSTEKFIKLQ